MNMKPKNCTNKKYINWSGMTYNQLVSFFNNPRFKSKRTVIKYRAMNHVEYQLSDFMRLGWSKD